MSAKTIDDATIPNADGTDTENGAKGKRCRRGDAAQGKAGEGEDF